MEKETDSGVEGGHGVPFNPLVLLNCLLRWGLGRVNAVIHSALASVATVLSRSFSITLRVSSIVIALIVLFAVAWAFVRYRFMTKYSRLPLDREDAETSAADMWLDDNEETNDQAKPGYATYFDEFLSAIKVFGYLDRKVFHELTRHMRTHRLDVGESVKLKDLDGFALAIDGCVQVYCRGADVRHDDSGEYQLLNEVNRAAPISSLFSILALFADEVQLNDTLSHPSGLGTEDVPDIDLNGVRTEPEVRSSDFAQFNHDVIAVGKTASTIAVIPSESFRLLTRKYPSQTASIVQVILLRWSRVTFRTCHNYLDLTPHIYDTEKLLNEYARSNLPSWLRDGGVQRLRALAQDEPHENVFSLKARKKGRVLPSGSHFTSHHLHLEHQVDKSYPGDLLSNVALSRTESSLSVLAHDGANMVPNAKATPAWRRASIEDIKKSEVTAVVRRAPLWHNLTFQPENEFSSGSKETEDAALRRALVEEMFAIIGFDSTVLPRSQKGSVVLSTPNSPLVLPQTGVRMNLNLSSSDNVPSETMSLDDGAASSRHSVSYETIVEQASDSIDIMFFRKGTTVSSEGEKAGGIYYVMDGTLSLYGISDGVHRDLYDVNPGGVAGYLETVASYCAHVNITAKTDVCVAHLPREKFEKLADRYPLFYLSIAKTLVSFLTRPTILLDFALEWVNIKSGEILFREGDEADAIYFVLNGRLRMFTENEESDAAKTVSSLKGEYGQGSSLGQLEVFLGDKYRTTAVGVRETELARFPRVLVELLAQMFPQSTFEMAKIVAGEVFRRDEGLVKNPTTNIRTVAILPLTEGLPIQEFAQKLATAFRGNGRDIAMLTNATVLGYLGRYAFSKLGLLKLKTYLADLEQQHETVVYVADAPAKSQWTKTCIDHADCILLVADASEPPTFGEYEKLVVKSRASARSHLVLLHQSSIVESGSTAKWLKNRPWVTTHHHVQMEFKPSEATPSRKERLDKQSLKRLRQIKNKVQEEIFNRPKPKPTVVTAHNRYRFKNDFNRIARILSGEAVGLVLGGGGARGLSHIGVLRALDEAGVPVDMVGGTSIGSFVGGLYAREFDVVPVYGRAKKFAGRMASLWRMVLDVTYPTTSYTTGHEFNRGIWKTFGDSRMEDFWLQYFNNTTNLTQSRMEIHKTGYAWRYIRASMSLAGLVPPIESKGQMLLDGGYMDNLPVRAMRQMGAKHIFAVDVGSVDDTTEMHYGDTLSGLWVLFNRWNPFSSHPRVPNLAEIQARLAYVSSVKALEEAKNTSGVIYLRPPIDMYATLDFGKFDEIVTVGYAYTLRKLRELTEKKEMPIVPGVSNLKGPQPVRYRRHSM